MSIKQITSRLESELKHLEHEYRVELPKERLTAEFTEDSTLTLTPELLAKALHRADTAGARATPFPGHLR